MPELPEVETIVRGLQKKVVGRKITSVWVGAPKLIKNRTVKNFEKDIKDLKIESINRRAKNIIFALSKDKMMLIHQKMTGHLLYGKWRVINRKPASVRRSADYSEVKPLIRGVLEDRNNSYIRVIFYLDNGWQMALSDMRKFAKIVLGSKSEIEVLPDLINLGPEPLEKSFDFKKLKSVLATKKGRIKSVLMDPKVIAGIGNIYADEILWIARINPFVPANSINDAGLKRMLSAIKSILKKAIEKGGSSIGDYRNSSGGSGGYQKIHKVYGREGLPCPRCQTKISRQKIGGRSAHFCPKCQK